MYMSFWRIKVWYELILQERTKVMTILLKGTHNYFLVFYKVSSIIILLQVNINTSNHSKLVLYLKIFSSFRRQWII